MACESESLGINFVPRMQIRERLGCISIPSHALIHKTKKKIAVFPKNVPDVDNQGGRGLSASSAKAKHSLHELHLSLLQKLGGKVHSKCHRELQEMVGRIIMGSQCNAWQNGLDAVCAADTRLLCDPRQTVVFSISCMHTMTAVESAFQNTRKKSATGFQSN